MRESEQQRGSEKMSIFHGFSLPFSVWNANVLVTLGFVHRALIVVVTFDANLVFASRQRRVFAMRIRDTRHALGLVITNGFGRVDAIRILHTDYTPPVIRADRFRGTAIGLRDAFDTRTGTQVAQRPPRVRAIGVVGADRSTIMVGRANRGASTLRVYKALLAISILYIANGICRAAIGIRCALAALRPVGVANGFIGRALGIRGTFDAHPRRYVARGCISRTIAVGGARNVTAVIFRMTHLPRIAIAAGATLLAPTHDAKR